MSNLDPIEEIVDSEEGGVSSTPESSLNSESSSEPKALPMTDAELQGSIIQGEVTSVAPFGVFVRIHTGEEGLVHISEIANEYITDINSLIKVGDKVTVRVLGRNEKKKLDFSIKQAKVKEPDPALFIKQKIKNPGFEDRLSNFLKKSEEKQIDIRRNLKNKQGVSKRRK